MLLAGDVRTVTDSGLAKYTIKSCVEEDPRIEYNDGAHKIYLSSLPGQKGNMSEELRYFLSYVNGGCAEGDFAQRLESAVTRAKSMESWRKEYVFLYEIKDEARAEGIEEGRAEERERSEQKKRESARKLKSAGVADDIIADSLELSLDEIKVLPPI